MKLNPYIDACLRGSGQVLFQDSALSGLLFLMAIFTASLETGFNALIGLITTTLLAKSFRRNSQHFQHGLYGYNGLLVGAMASLFYKEHSILVTLAGSLGAIFFQLSVEKYFTRIPLLTFPFVLSSWVCLTLFSHETISASSFMFFHHFSQVFLIGNGISGVLILFGLLIHSRKAFLYALVAGLFTELLNRVFHLNVLGFSAVLTAIALGSVFPQKIWKTALAILATLILQISLDAFFPALTFPFILVVWLFLSV